MVIFGIVGLAFGAAISGNDSTQPRGAIVETNSQGQLLDPIIDGFRAPARFDLEFEGEFDGKNPYRDWVGGLMANATRDPGFFATLNVANRDLIEFIRYLSDSDLAAFLAANQLQNDVSRDGGIGGTFKCISSKCEADNAEDLLPVAADLCLRCHTPAGWMEAHSEPATSSFPFLKGQFWGAAFPEVPDGGLGITDQSEAEMEGVQCDFCHRAYDNFKRVSNHDGSTMPAGNGGFFVDTTNPFDSGDGLTEVSRPKGDAAENFQKSAFLCGTCHDVTNPFIKTKNKIGDEVPDMLHPLERTFTEWYWSDFRGKKPCQECHEPMRFVGAQSWLLYPGLDNFWGDLDQQWIERGIDLTTSRAIALEDGMKENRRFMKNCAELKFVDSQKKASLDDNVTVTVRVTNRAGHKLPTGYGEGRQMWIHIKAVDKDGQLIFENGQLDSSGKLVRDVQTKVYEQKIEADGYDTRVISPEDEEFHFVLLNKITKDNRIPPKGFNKAAYQADGAFIVPADTYEDGQNWDETTYTFTLPDDISENVTVRATLYYQTFNREYIDFLSSHDEEPTIADFGRARNLPTVGIYNEKDTWAEALKTMWEDAGESRSVEMATAKWEIEIKVGESTVSNGGGDASGDGGGGGGCFIATAAYGSLMEPHVKILRDFRDRFLITNTIGNSFVKLYYKYSPPLANFIAKHDSLRAMVRISLLPVVGISWITLKIGPVSTVALMLLFISCFVGLVWFRRRYKE
jgi:hypothetical protein